MSITILFHKFVVVLSLTYPLELALLLKFFEKMQAISLCSFAAHQQTSTLTRQKFGFFYAKARAKFNDIGLFFSLKATGKARKMAKTKVVQKNANRRRSEIKG